MSSLPVRVLSAPRPDAPPSRDGWCVAVYDAGFSLRAASPGTGAFFARWPGLARGEGIPAAATAFVREQVTLAHSAPERQRSALLVDGLAVHVAVVDGPGGGLTIATFRTFATRDPLRSAARRYALTPRERQILECLLRGMRAVEIGRRLRVSELTVGDYVKRLRAKTGARTQSGMIAMLLGGCRALRDTDDEAAEGRRLRGTRSP